MTNSFPRSSVIAACQQYGPQLQVDPSLNGAAVMRAIASNESSLGANCGPRHEPAYDVYGSVYESNAVQRQLVTEYGGAAASSYGPWQMMYINFDRGIEPSQLLTDLDICAQQFVKFFNKYVISFRKAVTLSDIGQVWNSGHISKEPSPGVQTYCDHLQENYGEANV